MYTGGALESKIDAKVTIIELYTQEGIGKA